MQSAKAGLQKIMAGIIATAPEGEAALLAWGAVCGPSVASKTRAVVLADGVLTVAVPDAAWQAQLAGFERQYLAGLRQLVPSQVNSLKFVIEAA